MKNAPFQASLFQKPITLCLGRWRRFSRTAWFLHVWLITSLILLPCPSSRASWTDTDSDGNLDSWVDPSSGATSSLSAMDSTSQDIDSDGAYNSEELDYGSDPLKYDTDGDGINDGDEIHLSSGQFSPTLWDTDGDSVSDHDAFYSYYTVTYPGGQLPAFSGASYSDYDGDGTKNPFDFYPTDPLNNDADGDGIDDSSDPVPGDSTNWSSANSTYWYGSALSDDDGDTILNFWDAWPSDANNGNYWDSDNDGIANGSDPFPGDASNYSGTNSITWYGNVFGDEDNDGTPNHSDSWPYDSYNGISPIIDTDADDDGFDDYVDPATYDASNYSSTNGISWNGIALQDDDNDGVSNFSDGYPYDTFDNLPDFDNDGWVNAEDPFPKDLSNYSNINDTSWGTFLFGDDDSDDLLNWQDPLPSDTYNGDPDFDGDSIPNETDPMPKSAANVSTVNEIAWAADALGDEDGDGTSNWSDDTPYPIDTDADDDGFSDDTDPFPSDVNNYSATNSIQWFGYVLGDDDGDGNLNWNDPWPSDANNGGSISNDADGDGMENSTDPAPNDFSNYSYHNFTNWYGNALGDNDSDGTANFWDYDPNSGGNRDGDSYPDSSDPAPDDSANYSYANYNSWYDSALGDDDGDGNSNFYDPTPYIVCPPTDSDGDGLDWDQEAQWGTSDEDNDSDDDGLTDGEEVNIYSTIPTNAYSLSQSQNSGDLYTDWQLVDLTDSDEGQGDGIPDRIEQHYNLDPHWRGDAFLDKDQNGINNVTQYQMGIALDADLVFYDLDQDGMSDVFEDYYELRKSDPTDAVDDADADGVMNHEEMALVLSPRQTDTTGIGGLGDLQALMLSILYPDGSPPDSDADVNGIPDWADDMIASPLAPENVHFTRSTPEDLDGDGLPDLWEYEYGRWKHNTNGLQLRVDDADTDSDGDTLSNITEYQIGTSPLAGDSDDDSVTDGDEDADGDGLTNTQEAQHGTKAWLRDSDGDGVEDGQEITEGTDPNNAASNVRNLVGLQVCSRVEPNSKVNQGSLPNSPSL